MIDPDKIPEVAPNEQLARYLTQSSQFRKSDQTVKQDAFIPHPHLVLSVTRHLDASEAEVWQLGRAIAISQSRTLYGRADIRAIDCIDSGLQVKPMPVEGNPNHADITGWPTAKQDQKAIALKLGAAAQFVPVLKNE